MFACLINILLVANDIQTINVHRYNAKPCLGSFDEDTWAIIIVGVSLL
jgi:hypothetical protein